MTKRLTTSVAIAALALAAAACSKPADTANTTTPADTQATSANGTATAADATAAKGSDTVDKVQDMASATVGPITAATAGSLSSAAFVDSAAQSDMYETESSKLALERSNAPAIKKFAREMISAHGKTTKELTGLVEGGKTGDAKLPTALDQRRQGLIDNLKSASADDFDPRFVDQQAAAHRETEILMKGYSMAGSNADLKAFAAKTSPVVASHTKMVEDLDRTNKDKDAPGTPKTDAKS